MPRYWVPLDVNYQDDPAIAVCSPEAELVYLRSLALAKKLNSDGFVDERLLARLTLGWESRPDFDARAVVKELLDQGLWCEAPGGWRIAGWAKHNQPSSAASEAGILGNHQRWHAEEPSPDCPYCSPPDRDPTRPPIAPRSGTRSQSRVEKSREEKGTGPSGPPAPEVVADAVREWAAEHVPGVSVDLEAAKLVDWARAKGVRRKDWPASLRNWCRKTHADVLGASNGRAQPRLTLPPMVTTCGECGGLVGIDCHHAPP